MYPISPEVQSERIRVIEREIREIKEDLKDQSEDIDNLPIILHRLGQIENTLGTMSKDAGWRGFFIDFIKTAVQIAILVGAGKLIL